MKVCFETFGCRLNRAEALEREAEYLAKGWTLAKNHAEADLFIVRGCSVTARAQRDCEKLIDHLKRHYPLKRIIIEGCLPDVKPSPVQAEKPPVPTRTARAYLKVQDGCSGKCTFCIVPKFRGPSVSVDLNDVLDRAKLFIDAGYHEIVVTGCNLALYASKGKRLPELTAALAALSPDCRIRIGSVEPGPVALELVNTIAESRNCCRFLHIPVQYGSNRILTAMRRPYLIKDVDELVKSAVRLMPRIGLGCDLMTGFPGESEADFISTQGLLKRYPFSNAHVFPYSARPGTIAASSIDMLPREVRHDRAHVISDSATRKRSSLAKLFVGSDVDVLIEDEKKRTGWTGEYFKCKIGGIARLTRKSIVRVHVMDSKHGELSGIIISE